MSHLTTSTERKVLFVARCEGDRLNREESQDGVVRPTTDGRPSILSIGVPNGRWVRRIDKLNATGYGFPVPVLAYGLDDNVLIINDDGSHMIASLDERFPSSNWEVWDEVE